MTGVGPDWGAIASGWHLAPGPLVLLGACAAAYAVGVARVAREARTGRRGRRWPVARSVAFAGGLAGVLVALLSGLDARADEQLSTHMLQHLLLTSIAAPLLVAGAPLSLALQATRGATRRALADAIRSRPIRWLTSPPVAFALFAAVTLGTHLTGFYDAALGSPVLHGVEHLLYLATGVLFWLPLMGANPVPQLRSWAGRTIYLLLSMPVMSIVGVALVSATDVWYPTYAQAAAAAGVSALADQEAAGALMWVGGTVVLAVALIALGFQAMLAEERRQQALDAMAAGADLRRGVPEVGAAQREVRA